LCTHGSSRLSCAQVSASQINKLEELWKTNPDATFEEINQPGVDDEPVPVMVPVHMCTPWNMQHSRR
jgi:hypothetical protein